MRDRTSLAAVEFELDDSYRTWVIEEPRKERAAVPALS